MSSDPVHFQRSDHHHCWLMVAHLMAQIGLLVRHSVQSNAGHRLNQRNNACKPVCSTEGRKLSRRDSVAHRS